MYRKNHRSKGIALFLLPCYNQLEVTFMSRSTRIFFIIISLLALLNVIFAPMYDVGGGMLTDDSDYNFARVIGDAIMTEGGLGHWALHMTMGVFIPAVIMLACAITRMRWVYGFANTLGVFVWLFNFFRYAIDHGFVGMFDVETTDISIGSWIAIMLFLISELVLLCTKKKKDEPQRAVNEKQFCPYCGIMLRGNTSYCRRCGKKL